MNRKRNSEQSEDQIELPSLDQIEAALKKEQYRSNYGRVLKSTIFSLS